MDYKRIHDLIIQKAQNRKIDQYTEKHHIIPKCTGGLDTKENTVRLTPEEHFLIHKLLCKIYPNVRGLFFAIRMMCRKTNHLENKRINNKIFGHLKRLISEKHSEYWKEKWKDSEFRNKMVQQRQYMTDEHKKNIGNGLKKVWEESSEEQRIKRIQGLKTGTVFAAEKNSALWKDNEYKNKILSARKEKRDKGLYKTNSSKLKELWKNPEFKEKMKNRKTRGLGSKNEN